VEYPPIKYNAQQFVQQQSTADDVRADQRKQLLEVIEPQGPPAFTEGNIDAPITWLFDPESFAPMAKLAGNERYSIITDHLGTPMVMFDAQGQQVWSGEVDIWGNVRKLHGEKDFCPFRFAGQYEDGETGLYYNRFRYYDPEAGQYIRQDPIGLAGGMRLYGYVNDPLTWIDPLGLSRRRPRPTQENGGEGGPSCGSGGSPSNGNGTPEPTTRVRHYTNRQGSNAIEASGKMIARDNNRIYLEPASKKPLSQVEVEDKYQIGRGRGRDYVETDVPNSRLEWVRNPRYGADELTVEGDLELINPKFFRRR
jgi:RHS repeat-associated protein